MKNMNKFNRSTMEYGFVLIIALMSAADKIFITTTKSWWSVLGVIGTYYLVLFLADILDKMLTWFIKYLEDKGK